MSSKGAVSSTPVVDSGKSTAELKSLLSAANERQTNYNLAICCIVLFCAEASRGLFIPSLWSCVQHIGMDHSFLSWCIPIFSVGRMFGSYVAGRLSDHWHDDGIPTIACLIASIFGGFTYVMADFHRSWMLLLVAEFGMGLGGGTLAVLRAHVSKITTDKHRVTHTTYISTAQFAGLGLMPLVALGINYYFVGPEHHEELAQHRANAADMLLMAATGVASDLLMDPYSTHPRLHEAAGIDSHYRTHGNPEHFSQNEGFEDEISHQGSYHAGLENSNRHGFRHTSIHAAKQPQPSSHAYGMSQQQRSNGGRSLLSSAVGGSVAAVGPLTMHPDTLPLDPDAAATFFERVLNHRTAPAWLLILLNVACLLLYFAYFEAGHHSEEFLAKKKKEDEKKRVAEQVKAARARGEYDVDNVAAGESSAFSKSSGDDSVKSKGGSSSKKELFFDVSKLDAFIVPNADSSATAGREEKKQEEKDILGLGVGNSSEKELPNPLDEESDGSDSDVGSEPSTSPNNMSGSSAGSLQLPNTVLAVPSNAIVQVKDTTVITLKPFAEPDNAADAEVSENQTTVRRNKGGAADSIASSSSRNDDSHGHDIEGGMEMNRRQHSSSPTATKPQSKVQQLTSTFRSFGTNLVSVMQAIVHIVKHDKPPPKGDISGTGSINKSGGSSLAGNSSSQSQRINNYESGHAHVDLDHEGIHLGPLHLTPERMILWGSCLFVYLNYTIRGVLATVETVGTPTLAKFEGIPPGPLEVEASAKFFGILGLLGCVVFFFQYYFQDYIDEPTSLIAGFVVTVTGSTAILMFQDSKTYFIFGCVCIWSFGLPAVQNSVLAALSRILGTRPQGTWMGWIQTFGSLGRVTFPLIIKLSSVSFAFFLSSLGCGIAIVALIVYMKLVKMTM